MQTKETRHKREYFQIDPNIYVLCCMAETGLMNTRHLFLPKDVSGGAELFTTITIIPLKNQSKKQPCFFYISNSLKIPPRFTKFHGVRAPLHLKSIHSPWIPQSESLLIILLDHCVCLVQNPKTSNPLEDAGEGVEDVADETEDTTEDAGDVGLLEERRDSAKNTLEDVADDGEEVRDDDLEDGDEASDDGLEGGDDSGKDIVAEDRDSVGDSEFDFEEELSEEVAEFFVRVASGESATVAGGLGRGEEGDNLLELRLNGGDDRLAGRATGDTAKGGVDAKEVAVDGDVELEDLGPDVNVKTAGRTTVGAGSGGGGGGLGSGSNVLSGGGDSTTDGASSTARNNAQGGDASGGSQGSREGDGRDTDGADIILGGRRAAGGDSAGSRGSALGTDGVDGGGQDRVVLSTPAAGGGVGTTAGPGAGASGAPGGTPGGGPGISLDRAAQSLGGGGAAGAGVGTTLVDGGSGGEADGGGGEHCLSRGLHCCGWLVING